MVDIGGPNTYRISEIIIIWGEINIHFYGKVRIFIDRTVIIGEDFPGKDAIWFGYKNLSLSCWNPFFKIFILAFHISFLELASAETLLLKTHFWKVFGWAF